MPDDTDRGAGRDAARFGRLPFVDPASLSPVQQEVYDRITRSPRASANRNQPLTDDAGHLLGPFNAMLLSAELGGPLQELGTAIRYRGTLPARLREIAILEVARYRDCAVEWNAHSHAGHLVGISDSQLAAIYEGRDEPTFDQAERVTRRIVQRLLDQRDLDDELVTEADVHLGLSNANEIVILVGYYDLLALSLRVWRTPSPQISAPLDILQKDTTP